MYRGVAASPGVAINEVLVLEQKELIVPIRNLHKDEVRAEVLRFRESLTKTKQEFNRTREQIIKALGKGHARLLETYLVMVDDPLLTRNVPDIIKTDQINAEYALQRVINKVIKTLESVEDEFFRERSQDILGVYQKILLNLLGHERTDLSKINNAVILIARDLTPADTLSIPPGKVVGLATDGGGRTSHTAIVAQSLDIPAVVGLKSLSPNVRTGDIVIVDGNEGIVIVQPDEVTLANYRLMQERFSNEKQDLTKLRDLPTVTEDGHRVILQANIEIPDEIKTAVSSGAEGVGLYRTEFLYLKGHLPTEEEQYESYVRVAKGLFPNPVVIRTLDLGGDKVPILHQPETEIPRETNPFLGLRSVRFCLRHPDVFVTQLRAILRASCQGKIKILFPMISTIEELLTVKRIFNGVKDKLREDKIEVNDKMEIGTMIEVPSAALMIDIIATEVDFVSIGTNDLIQYTLAVDRSNENIAYLYEPQNPAIIRLIKNIVDTSHRLGKPVALCGEMAADPRFTLLLLGLGIDELSVPPSHILRIKRIIRMNTFTMAKEIADRVIKASSVEEVNRILSTTLKV